MLDAAVRALSGLGFAYASVQLPMIAGLIRGRAAADRYLVSPLVAAPLTVAAGLGMAVATPVLSSLGLAHGLVQLMLGTAAAGALGYAGGRSMARGAPERKAYQRGSVVDDRYPQREAAPGRAAAWARMAEQALAAFPARATIHARAAHRSRPAADARTAVHDPAARPAAPPPSITLGGTPVAREDEVKHFKMIGTTGTGKSTAIREMLSAALARGDRAVIADPDGGYLDRFYDPRRGDVVLNPFDERSVKWDLFAEIETDYDVDQLARSLIPDHDGADRSWSAYARTFFTAVTRRAHDAGVTDIGEWYRLMVAAEPAELRALVEGTPAQPFLHEANSRMFDSIRSVTSSAIGAVEYVARQESTGFSVREWIGSGSPGVLFMPYRAGQIAALRSTISSWMRLAIFEAMNGGEQSEHADSAPPRRLWFVVDELDALGPIDGLKDALARLRKFGGRCILGFQSIAQVSSTYGQGDAHTIVENCGNTLVLRCSASEGGGTARFASQLIGEREVLARTTSRSRRATDWFGSISRSETYRVEQAVMPSQIEQLPDLVGYLKYASDPAWRQIRIDALQSWSRRPASAAEHGSGRPDHRSPERHAAHDSARPADLKSARAASPDRDGHARE